MWSVGQRRVEYGDDAGPSFNFVQALFAFFFFFFFFLFFFSVWLDTQVLFGERLGKVVTGLVRQFEWLVLTIVEGTGMVRV